MNMESYESCDEKDHEQAEKSNQDHQGARPLTTVFGSEINFPSIHTLF